MEISPERLAELAKPDYKPKADVDAMLHDSGRSAATILCSMCDVEIVCGNPRNVPEPMILWYTNELLAQLLDAEAKRSSRMAREEIAKRLGVVIKHLIRYHTESAGAGGIVIEVEGHLVGRAVPLEFKGEDMTYGGSVPQ